MAVFTKNCEALLLIMALMEEKLKDGRRQEGRESDQNATEMDRWTDRREQPYPLKGKGNNELNKHNAWLMHRSVTAVLHPASRGTCV